MAVGLGAAVVGVFGASATAAVAATGFAAVINGVIGGAIIGAAVGGLTAAITGGDIGKGLLFGAVGGAVAGGISGYVAGAANVGGATSNAVNTGMSGAEAGHVANSGATSYGASHATGAVGVGTVSKNTADLGNLVKDGAGTVGKEGAFEIIGKGMEGYYADEAMQDQLAAQEREAATQRAWQAEQNELNRSHEQNMLALGGGGSSSGLLQYKLGMSQLDENIRQFDVQRRDYLKARSTAKEALGGFRIKKAEPKENEGALDFAERTAIV